MNLMGVVSAALVIGTVGLFVGLLLVGAAAKFHVNKDEREEKVRGLLPGNNCGGCGYAGCDALAAAIAAGEADVSSCPVGGSRVGKAIAKIMGVDAGNKVRMVAYVKCAGTCDKTQDKSNYYGVEDCRMAVIVPGRTSKKCTYGCLGYGTCVKVCPFDAVHLENGIAKVDPGACKACGKCVAACPNSLIELVPYRSRYRVQCSSNDKGKAVREACDVGCIACRACERACEYGAVIVENNLARIDSEKCVGCGACAEKCPTRVIRIEGK